MTRTTTTSTTTTTCRTTATGPATRRTTTSSLLPTRSGYYPAASPTAWTWVSSPIFLMQKICKLLQKSWARHHRLHLPVSFIPSIRPCGGQVQLGQRNCLYGRQIERHNHISAAVLQWSYLYQHLA